MSFESKTYYSQLYRNFRSIEPNEYRRMVLFFERNEKNVISLETEEYMDVLWMYTNALYEVGQYRKHTLMADTIIELSIENNITHIRNEEVYRSTLFKKSVSHYQLHENKKSIHILTELLKIDPQDGLVLRFLKRLHREQNPTFLIRARAIGIFFLIIATLMFVSETIFVRHFYADLASKFIWYRNFAISLSALFLFGGLIVYRVQVNYKVLKLQKQVIEAKFMKKLKSTTSSKST